MSLILSSYKQYATIKDSCEKQLQEAYDRFRERGYSDQKLFVAKNKALKHVPHDKSEGHGKLKRMVITSQYSTGSPITRNIINKNWSILASDNNLPSTLKQKPIWGYKQGKDLKDILKPTDPLECYNVTPLRLAPLKNGCYQCAVCTVNW